MSNALREIQMYFQYDFVRYAFIVGILIALCASILGVSLVLKRLSYIGDSLAHSAFGLMAVGTFLSFMDSMVFTLLGTVAFSVVLTYRNDSEKMRGDAALTMLTSSSLGVGYLIMNVGDVSSNLAADVCATLFGSTAILTLSRDEVWLCAILSVVVVVIYILCYNNIFATTFDGNFAKATGLKVGIYNALHSVVLAIIIVLAINLVGSLLISALIVFPALASMRVFKSFKGVIISAAIFSVITSGIGLILAILWGTPVGSTIVAVNLVGYIIYCIIGRFIK